MTRKTASNPSFGQEEGRREDQLDLVLREFGLERALDIQEFRRRFADDPQAAETVIRALQRYHELRATLRRGRRPPILAPGEHVGGLEIEAFLERGGVGEVYRARQLSLEGRTVALKILPLTELSRNERARFLREARLASRLHHRHLVEVYEAGEDRERGVLFYAMRLVPGTTLRSALEGLVQHRPPDTSLCRAIVERLSEVASALSLLHEQGLVHRDVKPSNIILEGEHGDPLSSPAVLVDYGLVRPVDEALTLSSVRLTVPYAAPEQLLGKPVDPRADVFAVGVILHDLLAARMPPYRGTTSEGLEPLRRLAPSVDRDLEAIVLKATSPWPLERYSDAGTLGMDLRAWLDGRPTRARALGHLERVRRWILAHPGQILRMTVRTAAIGTVLVLVAIAIFFGAQTMNRARAASTAWQEGDAVKVVRALAELPGFLDDLLLPKDLADQGGGLRGGTTATDLLPAVYRTALQDPATALCEAVAHLERDGIDQHPALARFLVRALREEPRDVMLLAARLFLERPDKTPSAVAASAPIRRTLMSILEHAQNEETVQLALTAISGCGTPREAKKLAEWGRARAVKGTPAAEEDLRLTFAALSQILFWRADDCEFLNELDGEGLEELLATASDAVYELDRGHDSPAAVSAEALFRNIELARRLAVLGPGRVVPTWKENNSPSQLMAVRRDPNLLEMLKAGPGCMTADTIEALFHDYGRLIGSYSDEPLARSMEAAVEEEARNVGVNVTDAIFLYQRGLERAAVALKGEAPHALPDEDTHLGRLAAQLDSPWRSIPTRSSPLPPGVVADANFDLLEPALSGEAELQGRCVLLQEQEWNPGHGFARLGVFGVSALRLSFIQPAEVALHAVEIHLQKATRWRLPNLGTARLDIFLDEKGIAENVALRSGGLERIVLPLGIPASSVSRFRQVELHLSPKANTTLRIHRLSVITEGE